MSGAESDGLSYEVVEMVGEEVEYVSKWKRIKRTLWGLVHWAGRREDGSAYADEWVRYSELGDFWRAEGKRRTARCRTGRPARERRRRRARRRGSGNHIFLR